ETTIRRFSPGSPEIARSSCPIQPSKSTPRSAAVFDETMHLVEQRRQPLHLVHHDRRAGGHGNPRKTDRWRAVAKVHTMAYHREMPQFDWNDAKSVALKAARGVSFEDVVFHVATGGLLDVLDHPNPAAYPGQRIMIVDIDGYAFVVPFVPDGDVMFLKSIIPSRKMTKHYLGASNEEDRS
ncbi:MAG: BrnT family toxin, partial [Planctomycetia bacterium]